MSKAAPYAAHFKTPVASWLAGVVVSALVLTSCDSQTQTDAETAASVQGESDAAAGRAAVPSESFLHRNWSSLKTGNGSVLRSFVDQHEHETDYELLPEELGKQLKGVPVYIDETGLAVDVAPEDLHPEGAEFFEATEPLEVVGEDGNIVVLSDHPPE